MRTKTNREGFRNEIIGSRMPLFCEPSDMTKDQMRLFTDNPTFCILPWTHLHVYPDNRVFPCCDSVYNFPIGDANEFSLKEIWNQPAIREMRRKMINGKPCKQCTKCYESEKHGIYSLRHSFSKTFGHNIPELLEKMHPDGTLDIFKLRYSDIRFSNLCNMKCRTCGDTFSSAWAKENTDRLSWYDKKILIQSGRTPTDMMEQLENHIPYVEQIYFAGGEPLMMSEHYQIIKELVDRKMFHVRLAYNTNFSRIEYGGHNILEMWKLFENVSVGASLDAEGKRAEYMRKGTEWDKIIKNRKRMLEICPNVNFYVSNTVSIFNVFTMTDFHKNWVDQDLIGPLDWSNNILQDPSDRRIDVLPLDIKDLVRDKIKNHIEWLKQNDAEVAISSYESIISLMDGDDKTDMIPVFLRVNDELDKFRNESLDTIFPELKELRKYAK